VHGREVWAAVAGLVGLPQPELLSELVHELRRTTVQATLHALNDVSMERRLLEGIEEATQE
jgi:hypothetical protein